MIQRNDTTASFEQWLEMLRSSCARYNAQCNDERTFIGWVRPLTLGGIEGTDVGCNASSVDRTHRDIKFDGAEHFLVGQQLTGAADVVQDARVLRAEPGDIVLIDTSRLMRYRPSGTCNLLSLKLPRRSCIAHLDFEPKIGVCRPNTLAARLLSHLFDSVRHEPILRESEPDVDIIVYDLVRALFGAAESTPVSSYSDRLFQRVCRIVENHFTDPNVGPAEIAAEAGISLRYLQKLFACRGTTCGQYIQSLRLGHAFTLLARRPDVKGGQSISEIAWASGYRDLSYFHRVFRRRFGHSPGRRHWRDEATRREGIVAGAGDLAAHCSIVGLP
jgi:AraC family transcriptional regulator, positive regulator of tynA and feaB